MRSLPASLPTISRQHSASTSHSTLSPVYERRHICIAHGTERHPDQLPPEWLLNPYFDPLLPRFPHVEKVSDHEYRNHRQRVIFTIRETTDKSVFREWLATPELHVIYRGHARHGRGPCFGRATEEALKTQDWGEGTNSATTGIFRMGFPFIGIPVDEIIEHGYSAKLLEESEGPPPAADCHPNLRPYRRLLQPRTAQQIHPELPPLIRHHAPGRRYLAYPDGDAWNVVHHAGWRNTHSHPSEWGAVDVRCRVFCFFGCSSFRHNYPIVRKIARWRREGNERYAYWTTSPSRSVTPSRWIANLITYDVENAFAPWGPSLEYAVSRTNRDLRKEGYTFQLI
ncbi:MAG: hypothetical protein INH40_00355 [Acidobacteriaceae bacterium]|jgi:hypothetical protein|nr:hypothetical protein [Acidobacteriaceae bacterium]